MAAPVLTFTALKAKIAKGDVAPVYILHGDEGYYTDELVKEFENLLPEEDREFNRYVLYAPQCTPGEIMDIANRYPMMVERQLVIVKEAQSVNAQVINRLARYAENPAPFTVLVIVFRGATAKGKELIAAVKSKGIVFESKKAKDYQFPALIDEAIKKNGLRADAKSVSMLNEFIGTDLSRLYNEIAKLATLLGQGGTITPEIIEKNIGVSKEFNNFELIDAIAAKNAAKCFRIVEYFTSNPKNNPVPVVIGMLYGFFSDLLVAFYAPDKSEGGLMKALDLKWPVMLRKFRMGMQNYNAFQVIEAIRALRECDNMSKGNGSRQDPYNLLHDLVFHLLTAPGNLGV